MRKQTFSKNERLKSRKAIEALFANNQSIRAYPLRLVYHLVDLPEGIEGLSHFKCGVSVSAKRFRKAVTRNLLKRRMRESYRLQKNLLTLPRDQKQLNMMFIYTGQEAYSYHQIYRATTKLLSKLAVVLPQ